MIFKIIEWFLILGFVLTVIGLKFLWPWPLIMGIALLGSLPMLTVVSLFSRLTRRFRLPAVIPDLVFAAIAGMATRNFLVFLILCLLAVVFNRTDRPLSGNVIKFAAVAAFSLIEFVVLLVGISALFSLFGGYGDKHDT